MTICYVSEEAVCVFVCVCVCVNMRMKRHKPHSDPLKWNIPPPPPLLLTASTEIHVFVSRQSFKQICVNIFNCYTAAASSSDFSSSFLAKIIPLHLNNLNIFVDQKKNEKKNQNQKSECNFSRFGWPYRCSMSWLLSDHATTPNPIYAVSKNSFQMDLTHC